MAYPGMKTRYNRHMKPIAVVTRDLTQNKCPWLTSTIPINTKLYQLGESIRPSRDEETEGDLFRLLPNGEPIAIPSDSWKFISSRIDLPLHGHDQKPMMDLSEADPGETKHQPPTVPYICEPTFTSCNFYFNGDRLRSSQSISAFYEDVERDAAEKAWHKWFTEDHPNGHIHSGPRLIELRESFVMGWLMRAMARVKS